MVGLAAIRPEHEYTARHISPYSKLATKSTLEAKIEEGELGG